MTLIGLTFLLMVIFQFKHFIADYLLQTKKMLGKFSTQLDVWFPALMSHGLVHLWFSAVITFSTLMLMGKSFGNSVLFGLCFGSVDFIIHVVMDRIKASPYLLGQFNALSKDEYKNLLEELEFVSTKSRYLNHLKKLPNYSENIKDKIKEKFRNNTIFWYCLGLDQMVHHLTDLLVVALIIWAI